MSGFLARKGSSDFPIKALFLPCQGRSCASVPSLVTLTGEALPCPALPQTFRRIVDISLHKYFADAFSRITRHFYPWSPVSTQPEGAHGACSWKWKVGMSHGLPPLEVTTLFEEFKQMMFSDCILSCLQEKVDSGMFWRDGYHSDYQERMTTIEGSPS